MIELYLDCEFNGTHGFLISLALYNPKGNGYDFYEVEEWESMFVNEERGGLKQWVKENVIPKLIKKSIYRMELQAKLLTYFSNFNENDEIIIYADWPEDFVHLLKLLVTVNPNTHVPSKCLPKLTMKLITTPDTHISNMPHNALEDAKALYLNHFAMEARK